MGDFFRETIVMQKFRQNDSFIKQYLSFSRKNIVKIKILQTKLQFDNFFVKTTNFTTAAVAYTVNSIIVAALY